MISLTIGVGIAGAAGAMLRVVADGEMRRRLPAGIPWQTAVINVTGSLLVGLVAGLVAAAAVGPNWQTVLATGFCGGYTTFSTATIETLTLARTGRARATLYLLVSLGLSLAACAAGLGIARLF